MNARKNSIVNWKFGLFGLVGVGALFATTGCIPPFDPISMGLAAVIALIGGF
ncbi:MAG: hypothetical protein U1A27_01950 [Phycisphaerae bacterium]